MIVLIPHPTEYLKLVRFQKKVIKLLSTDFSAKENIICQKLPLWIPLSDSFCKTQDLKSISRMIDSAQINFNDNLSLNLIINGQSVSLFSLWNLISKTPDKNLSLQDFSITDEDLKKINASEIFPMHLRIFRLGKQIFLNDTSTAADKKAVTQGLEESIWVKLK